LTRARKSGMYDLLRSGYAGLNLVSTRLVHCLTEIGATGWDTVPVRLTWKGRGEVSGYSILVVTGKAGPWQRRRSQRILKPPLVPGAPRPEVYRGLWFDEKSWDGSDVFALGETYMVMVTDRVARTFRRAKLKGFLLYPQEEWETWVLE
jgi:hypothetical protein